MGSPLLPSNAAIITPASLAAEAMVHLVEGWRFLSSATSAVLLNADDQAIHFAYYAELRAAFSLFSLFGLRISWKDSSYLNAQKNKGTPTWKNTPTHKVAWELWQEWIQSSHAEKLFYDQLIIFPSVSIRALHEVMSAISATQVLKSWGFDLLNLSGDHKARNEASYQPLLARKKLKKMQKRDYDFVRQLWALAEPNGSGLNFEVELAKYLFSQNLPIDPSERDERINHVVSNISNHTGVHSQNLDAILRQNPVAIDVFDSAFSTDLGAKNIMARAFFLLRIANLSIKESFDMYPESAGKGWLIDWLKYAGLVDPSGRMRPDDLWADFESLSTLQIPQKPLPYTLMQDPEGAMNVLRLGRHDAIMAWATGL